MASITHYHVNMYINSVTAYRSLLCISASPKHDQCTGSVLAMRLLLYQLIAANGLVLPDLISDANNLLHGQRPHSYGRTAFVQQ